MSAIGINTVRLYTLPPLDLLAAAEANGLGLLVGLQYHDWRLEHDTGRAARRRIADGGRAALDRTLERCHGFKDVIAVAVGNEVPVDLVRLHGVGHVEDTLSELIARVHAADQDLMATYVNFPTTEFLEIEGQDLVCFNVFLERPDAFRRYLRHLQIVAGDKPLLLTELGLASALHGREAQADSLGWQLEIITETGCAGACIFSWTDEWALNEQPVEGWGFGLTTARRDPKPSLETVGKWTSISVRDLRQDWPSLTVVVCAHNEERAITECLSSLMATDYPNLEVIVCVDGSTDRTYELASSFPFSVLDLPRGGLSAARNAGLGAANGEVIAFLDADAACHPEWPYFLVLSLEDEGVVATGGPNLPFTEAGAVEWAVAKSPGDPVEVLIGDDRAEHVPGCNMALKTEALRGIGGFDVAYTAAGDDVDVCWRLLDQGHEIAFAPAAQVRHHRRHSMSGYLKQQIGYGRAERMLSGAHPHRFNGLGQAKWEGVVYAKARFLPSFLRPLVYHGYQGAAPFQSVTRRPSEMATGWIGAHLPLLLPIALAGLVLSLATPWWLLVPGAGAASLIGFSGAIALGLRDPGVRYAGRTRLLAGFLHVAQPFARLWGRARGTRLPRIETETAWHGDRFQWLDDLRRELQAASLHVRIGEPHSIWDLEVSRGRFILARVSTAVVWSWEPRWKIRWGLRPACIGLAALTALTWIIGATTGLVVTAASLSALLFDVLQLRTRLNGALERTTKAARAGDAPATSKSETARRSPRQTRRLLEQQATDQPRALVHRYLSPKRIAAGEER